MPDHKYFMGFARHAATQSKDAETKVGAAIVGPEGEVRLTGYNGPPKGVADLPERLCRPDKYQWMSHAEQNIIAFAAREGIRTSGCTLYVTHTPCSNCARSIIQAGTICVAIGDGETTMSHAEKLVVQTMFDEAEVDLIVGFMPVSINRDPAPFWRNETPKFTAHELSALAEQGMTLTDEEHRIVHHHNGVTYDLPVEKEPTIPEGFIPWHGGECPVASGTIVSVQYIDGPIGVGSLPGENWRWDHRGNLGDIIAYRIHKPADFRLEAGKHYITASGERVGPMAPFERSVHPKVAFLCKEGDGRYWDVGGKGYNKAHGFDIIALAATQI